MLGTIGALVPFVTRDDVDFFTHLEMYMRQEALFLSGRDHLMYRSYYSPVKDVIDGDLCECYNLLDPAKQRSIAEELERYLNFFSNLISETNVDLLVKLLRNWRICGIV